METIIKDLIINPILQNFIIIIIFILISLAFTRNDKSYEYKHERFKKMVSPLFFMLEPFLYKTTIPKEEFNKIILFVEQNRYYADGTLWDCVDRCRNNPTPTNFIQLCRCVDRLYDRYSISLSLKLRPAIYRFDNRQFYKLTSIASYILMLNISMRKTVFLCFSITCVILRLPDEIIEKHFFLVSIVFVITAFYPVFVLIKEFAVIVLPRKKERSIFE